MNAKEFAWMYVVSTGYPGAKTSYYGGYRVNDFTIYPHLNTNSGHNVSVFDCRDLDKGRDVAIRRIKDVGIDWNKSFAPRSTYVSEFNGTFADPGRRESYEGTLILKDGTEIEWIADKMEVADVFEAMANTKKFEDLFVELEG